MSKESDKKYYYQSQIYKPLKNQNQINTISPNVNTSICSNINISAISTPIIYEDNIFDNSNQNPKRVKKYIFSDKKIKSRQYVKDNRKNYHKQNLE